MSETPGLYESSWHQEFRDIRYRFPYGYCTQCGEWWPCTQNEIATERDRAQSRISDLERENRDIISRANDHVQAMMVSEARVETLRDALQDLFDSYKQLADSGDAGFWSLEETVVGKKAMDALTATECNA